MKLPSLSVKMRSMKTLWTNPMHPGSEFREHVLFTFFALDVPPFTKLS